MMNKKGKCLRKHISVIVALVVIHLAFFSGCKKSDTYKPFDINGVWRLTETINYDDGSEESRTLSFYFEGNQIEGKIYEYPYPNAFQDGNYVSDSGEISFEYSIGRAYLWKLRSYTGVLNTETHTMQGTISGETKDSGETERTWTGTWRAFKTGIIAEK